MTRNTDLAQQWRSRADQLDKYAACCRREGFVQGAEGAEDAEQSARDYRIAADELEAAA